MSREKQYGSWIMLVIKGTGSEHGIHTSNLSLSWASQVTKSRVLGPGKTLKNIITAGRLWRRELKH